MVSSHTSVATFSEMRPPDSTTGVKARPTPDGLNSTEIWPSSELHRHREFAAREEARRFTGDGGEVRFGQHAQQTRALEGFDRRVRARERFDVRRAKCLVARGRIEAG